MGLPTKEALFLTGAGSGIGRAVAISLLAKGYEVFGSAISATEAAELRDALTGDIRPVEVDVRDEASVQAAAEQVADQLGDRPLRAVLNIAGIITNGPLVDLSAETFSQVLAVNLVGMHSVTRAFPTAAARPPARPRHQHELGQRVAHDAVHRRLLGQQVRRRGPVLAMRMEFAPLGVDVVVVAPGLINTPMAAQIKQDLERPPSLPVYRDALRRFLERTETSIENGIPMQRVVDAIVEAVQELTPAKRYELHNNFLRDVVLMRILPTAHREAIVRKTLGLVAGGGAR